MAKGRHEAAKKAKDKKQSSGRRGRRAAIIAAAAVAVIAAAALAAGVIVGRTSKIHPNMTLGGVEIGGMSVSQAESALRGGGWTFSGGSVEVTLPGEYKFTVSAEEAGAAFGCAAAAQAAYDYGHSGSPFKDLAAYIKCIGGGVTEGELMGAADADGLRTAVEAELSEYNKSAGAGYETDTENALLKMVKGGLPEVDTDKLCGMISEAFASGGGSVSYTAEASDGGDPDFEKLHDEICAEVLDAKYDPETKKASESRIGIEFDVSQAQKLWDEAENGETVKIPIEVTMPKYTTEQLDKMLFADKLGAMTTGYASSTENRATNVELSAAKINGTILNPGETFSYNEVVGKRTAAAGFKSAGAYAGGKVVQEIGGGICQTSSTLYCAALYANLDIVARDEHGFAVSYVPWGMDATVSWGGPEFKFRNDREFPVKIVTKCENRKLTIEIWGTDTDGSYVKVDYSAWTVYDKTYPSVAIGTGAVTYRCVYDKDGTLISRSKEADSYYHYHPENIQWPEPEPTPAPQPTPQPSQEPAPTPTPEPAPQATEPAAA